MHVNRPFSGRSVVHMLCYWSCFVSRVPCIASGWGGGGEGAVTWGMFPQAGEGTVAGSCFLYKERGGCSDASTRICVDVCVCLCVCVCVCVSMAKAGLVRTCLGWAGQGSLGWAGLGWAEPTICGTAVSKAVLPTLFFTAAVSCCPTSPSSCTYRKAPSAHHAPLLWPAMTRA